MLAGNDIVANSKECFGNLPPFLFGTSRSTCSVLNAIRFMPPQVCRPCHANVITDCISDRAFERSAESTSTSDALIDEECFRSMRPVSAHALNSTCEMRDAIRFVPPQVCRPCHSNVITDCISDRSFERSESSATRAGLTIDKEYLRNAWPTLHCASNATCNVQSAIQFVPPQVCRQCHTNVITDCISDRAFERSGRPVSIESVESDEESFRSTCPASPPQASSDVWEAIRFVPPQVFLPYHSNIITDCISDRTFEKPECSTSKESAAMGQDSFRSIWPNLHRVSDSTCDAKPAILFVPPQVCRPCRTNVITDCISDRTFERSIQPIDTDAVELKEETSSSMCTNLPCRSNSTCNDWGAIRFVPQQVCRPSQSNIITDCISDRAFERSAQPATRAKTYKRTFTTMSGKSSDEVVPSVKRFSSGHPIYEVPEALILPSLIKPSAETEPDATAGNQHEQLIWRLVICQNAPMFAPPSLGQL